MDSGGVPPKSHKLAPIAVSLNVLEKTKLSGEEKDSSSEVPNIQLNSGNKDSNIESFPKNQNRIEDLSVEKVKIQLDDLLSQKKRAENKLYEIDAKINNLRRQFPDKTFTQNKIDILSWILKQKNKSESIVDSKLNRYLKNDYQKILKRISMHIGIVLEFIYYAYRHNDFSTLDTMSINFSFVRKEFLLETQDIELSEFYNLVLQSIVDSMPPRLSGDSIEEFRKYFEYARDALNSIL